ncbi:MAG: DUF4129 domain-containing protein, partial [Anaerolineales bacterium]
GIYCSFRSSGCVSGWLLKHPMRSLTVQFRLLVLLLGIFILANAAPVLALPARRAITPDEFWQRVDTTLATLRGLKTQPKEVVTPALDTLADEWVQFDTLTLPGGASAPLDTSFLVSQLRQHPDNLDSLIDLFTDLKNAGGSKPTRSFGAADLAALQPILERPEFQWDRPPSPLEQWWNDLWARINDWFNKLFGQNGVNIPIPGDIFTIVAIILLVFVLLYVFRGLFSDFISEASMDEEQMAGDELLTAETALQKAKDISRGGDYRTAVRYLYLSSLLTLDERGLMRFDRSKTNREYLRSVAAFPQLSVPLRDVIDVFDRVWYGFRTLDEDSFQHYVEKVDQLREQKK